jgi:excisionase family DNA binding protein
MLADRDDIELMTVNDAAAVLGISTRRVLQLIAAGRLPATKLGWGYLIRRPDLALVAERRWGRPRKNHQYA